MSRPHDASTVLLLVLLLIGGCGARATSASQDETGASSVPAEVLARAGRCPVDTGKPIPKKVCSTARESSEGKWSEEDADLWKSDERPNLIEVRVRGGLTPCPESGESGAAEDYRAEWNREAQRCVRALIDELGGEPEDASLGQANVIVAALTWDQIQKLGKLVDVIEIKSL